MEKQTKTVVKGLRASQEFFDKCDLVAKGEGLDRNKLIVIIMSDYCTKKIQDNNTSKADLVEKVENEM